MPITAEYAYALHWNTALRPYVGVGLGAFYHKIYRSGADRTDLLPATVFKFGADTALDPHNVLGLDARAAWVLNDDEVVDPVFGKSKPTSIRWSVKLQYSRVF
jgi:outer membrane protein W